MALMAHMHLQTSYTVNRVQLGLRYPIDGYPYQKPSHLYLYSCVYFAGYRLINLLKFVLILFYFAVLMSVKT